MVTINAGGYVLTSEIDGAIVCKSFLAGRPQIKLALNEDLAVGRSEALALAGEYEGGRGALSLSPALKHPHLVLPILRNCRRAARNRTQPPSVVSAQLAQCLSSHVCPVLLGRAPVPQWFWTTATSTNPSSSTRSRLSACWCSRRRRGSSSL